MTELLEALMVISFGLSWPLSIAKSWRSRTARGKSLPFMLLIEFGYVCGVAWKAIEWAQSGTLRYPAVFYVLNLLMVGVDIALYFRNRRLDKMEAAA